MPSGPPPLDLEFALRALDLMGGDVDWVGIDAVLAMLGYDDVELLVEHWALLREHGR